MGLRAGRGATGVATAASRSRAEVWKLRAARGAIVDVESARAPDESILEAILVAANC